jgi:Pvc16 N-terminal domain/Carboxypeptidase regulatory-like domain
MIHHLDNLLRHLFLAQIEEITSEEQVSFQPPDEDWRGHVTNLQRNALNVYLVDLRDNRQLRSNERVRAVQNGIVSETPAPRRVDCQYLITAWSPAEITPAVEPTLDEHALLAAVTGVLMRNESLIPREVYAPDPLPATFPPEVADTELPTAVLPGEGFPKLAEFWGTMGENHRWKPAVYLVVTIPVILQTEIAGPMVTTRITEYRQTGKLDTAEVWVQIGGHVLDATNPLQDGSSAPVTGARVRLEDSEGKSLQTTETNDKGRFTFGQLRPGAYQLRWRATGHPEPAPRLIEVPSPSGEYDLIFA